MSIKKQKISHKIGTLNEKPLHAALKEWYAQPDDQFEVSVGGFHIDILRNGLLVEIQVQNFTAIKRKLKKLANNYHVRLVYPITREKWIVKIAQDKHSRSIRRKSPKRGSLENIFEELVSIPKLFLNPNFSMEVVFIQEEEIRRYDGKRCWRKNGWSTQERRLLNVMDSQLFETPAHFAALIPDSLAEPFTTSDLATVISKPPWIAQKMAYCLRKMNTIVPVGKRRNAILYTRSVEI